MVEQTLELVRGCAAGFVTQMSGHMSVTGRGVGSWELRPQDHSIGKFCKWPKRSSPSAMLRTLCCAHCGRYVDMIVTEGVINTFRARSLVNSTIRRFLEDKEFLEACAVSTLSVLFIL